MLLSNYILHIVYHNYILVLLFDDDLSNSVTALSCLMNAMIISQNSTFTKVAKRSDHNEVVSCQVNNLVTTSFNESRRSVDQYINVLCK